MASPRQGAVTPGFGAAELRSYPFPTRDVLRLSHTDPRAEKLIDAEVCSVCFKGKPSCHRAVANDDLIAALPIGCSDELTRKINMNVMLVESRSFQKKNRMERRVDQVLTGGRGLF